MPSAEGGARRENDADDRGEDPGPDEEGATAAGPGQCPDGDQGDPANGEQPPEFVSELSRLENAPTLPCAEVKQVLEESLAAPTGEKFSSSDEEPISAASIAQVHAATLPSGERVVVKIRRPGVTAVVAADLDIVQRLARQGTWRR